MPWTSEDTKHVAQNAGKTCIALGTSKNAIFFYAVVLFALIFWLLPEAERFKALDDIMSSWLVAFIGWGVAVLTFVIAQFFSEQRAKLQSEEIQRLTRQIDCLQDRLLAATSPSNVLRLTSPPTDQP